MALKEQLLQLFAQHPGAALLISILLNIFIAVLGLVPSVFITAANVLFFGFWPGTFISFLGEALGAAFSFLLYRKGFKQRTAHSLSRYPTLQRLVNATGMNAVALIISLRLLPFMPSGLVTFAAAIGTVPFTLFLLASSLGKAPALLIEAYAMYELTAGNRPGKFLLFALALLLLFWVWRKKTNL